MIIVSEKFKKAVREIANNGEKQFMVADGVYEVIDRNIQYMIKEACLRASANGRKKIQPCDI